MPEDTYLFTWGTVSTKVLLKMVKVQGFMFSSPKPMVVTTGSLALSPAIVLALYSQPLWKKVEPDFNKDDNNKDD